MDPKAMMKYKNAMMGLRNAGLGGPAMGAEALTPEAAELAAALGMAGAKGASRVLPYADLLRSTPTGEGEDEAIMKLLGAGYGPKEQVGPPAPSTTDAQINMLLQRFKDSEDADRQKAMMESLSKIRAESAPKPAPKDTPKPAPIKSIDQLRLRQKEVANPPASSSKDIITNLERIRLEQGNALNKKMVEEYKKSFDKINQEELDKLNKVKFK